MFFDTDANGVTDITSRHKDNENNQLIIHSTMHDTETGPTCVLKVNNVEFWFNDYNWLKFGSAFREQKPFQGKDFYGNELFINNDNKLITQCVSYPNTPKQNFNLIALNTKDILDIIKVGNLGLWQKEMLTVNEFVEKERMARVTKSKLEQSVLDAKYINDKDIGVRKDFAKLYDVKRCSSLKSLLTPFNRLVEENMDDVAKSKYLLEISKKLKNILDDSSYKMSDDYSMFQFIKIGEFIWLVEWPPTYDTVWIIPLKKFSSESEAADKIKSNY